MILTEIESSALGVGKSQKMLACIGIQPREVSARRPSGPADRTASFSPRDKIYAPWRSFSGANQIFVLPWSDSRALFARQMEAGSTVKLLG